MSTGLCLAAIPFEGVVGGLADGGSVKDGAALTAGRGCFLALIIGAATAVFR